MKTKILRIAILIVFLFLSAEGYSQINTQLNQLKGAGIINEGQAESHEGKVVTITVNSPGLEGNILDDSPDRPVSVYLPPGYNTNPDKHYPVIYLLGGLGCTHNFWFGGQAGINYNITGSLNNQINSGEINPVIIVSPDNYNKYEGSWFTNSSLAGNWEDFNAIDLVRSIDENFRTIPKPECRGIAGWSMGGYGAVMLAMKHPDIFSNLYSISGALLDFTERIINDTITKIDFTNSAKLTAVDLENPGNFGAAIAFAPNQNVVGFGELPYNVEGEIIDSVWQKWLVYDPASLVPVYKQNLEKLNALVLECGIGEPPIYNENLSFSEILTEQNIDYKLNIHEGDHYYSVNYRMNSHVFPFFSKNLQQLAVQLKCAQCLSNTDSVITQFDIDGNIYVVPLETSNNKEDILSSQVKSANTQAFAELKIPLNTFTNGIYKIVGISNQGYISEPVKFSVVQGTPQATFCAIDLITGAPIQNCQVSDNGELLQTNEKGNILVQGCGIHSIKFSIDNYFTEDTTFNIYTDTTIVMTLVKDSYVKFIDKATGANIPGVLVTQMGKSTKSGSNGIAQVQDLRNSTLNYYVYQSRYFREEGTTILNPGDTAVIALTNKKAKLEFIVKDDSGPVTNQNVVFNGKTVTTNKEGSAVFSNVDARKKYEYSLEASAYNTIQDSIFIELDTVMYIMLERITSAEDLSSPELNIYPNPFNDELFIQTNATREYSVELTTITGRTIYQAKIEGNFHRINLKEFSSGIYFVRMKSDNFISVKKVIKR